MPSLITESSKKKAFLIKSLCTGICELKLRLTNKTDGGICLLLPFQEVISTVPCVTIQEGFSFFFHVYGLTILTLKAVGI